VTSSAVNKTLPKPTSTCGLRFLYTCTIGKSVYQGEAYMLPILSVALHIKQGGALRSPAHHVCKVCTKNVHIGFNLREVKVRPCGPRLTIPPAAREVVGAQASAMWRRFHSTRANSLNNHQSGSEICSPLESRGVQWTSSWTWTQSCRMQVVHNTTTDQ
jgi:hypothetical protein